MPRYSTEIAATWLAVEKLGIVIGPTYITYPKAPKFRACIGWQPGLEKAEAIAKTAPLAICKSALKAVEAKAESAE